MLDDFNPTKDDLDNSGDTLEQHGKIMGAAAFQNIAFLLLFSSLTSPR